MIVSARDSDFDVVSGLRLGADDYLSKDASLAQLAARVSSLLRRVEALRQSSREEGAIEHGLLRLEPERMRVTWRAGQRFLRPSPRFDGARFCAIPARCEAASAAAEEAHVTTDAAAITSHIKRIRKKFLAVDPDFDAIETVHGAGYRWRLDDGSRRH